MTATATPGSRLGIAGWSGANSTSVNPISLSINTSLSLTGTFAQLPAFNLQPVSVTNKSGSTVSFSAHAAGGAPLSYRWFFNGGSLNAATNLTLSLTNISTGQAGTYWAVVTNNYGSATSYVASLTVTNGVGPLMWSIRQMKQTCARPSLWAR